MNFFLLLIIIGHSVFWAENKSLLCFIIISLENNFKVLLISILIFSNLYFVILRDF